MKRRKATSTHDVLAALHELDAQLVSATSTALQSQR